MLDYFWDMKRVTASIITIGDELLIGQVIDTNSSWIAQQLNNAGIAVLRRVAIGDDQAAIVNSLDAESDQADIILMTGGLGPTSDDITKQVLCDYFKGKMIVDEKALANVKYLFERVFKRPVSAINLLQAEVPDVCDVLQNHRGSAPGMVFYKANTIVISMPGVPYEMKGIMQDGVIPLLKSRFQLPFIEHRTLLTAGIGESALAEMISDFEMHLPEDIKLAYLPTYGMVRLRLSTTGDDALQLKAAVDACFEDLKLRVRDYLVTDVDDSLQVVIGKLLKTNNRSMATAESCTGGYIAHLITSVPGASQYFKGSVISYSNEMKESMLGVKKATLDNEGAVSEGTVVEMLGGLLGKIDADYGIAVSGIMGPDGGTPEKPVGLVWLAMGSRERVQTHQINLRFNRERNIEVTALMAINLLRKFVLTS